jgi:siroheme synthase
MERADEIQPPSIIVVGEVVSLNSTLKWFEPEARFLVR